MYGAWGGVVFMALCYYSDGPGIDSRWCHWIFRWHIPSDRTMALGSTQSLVKMSKCKGLPQQAEVAQVVPCRLISWIFLMFGTTWVVGRQPYAPLPQSENVYQEHFLVVKAAGAWDWQPLHFHMPNVMKSGTLNLLEPSGPQRACYGTPLPFYIISVGSTWLQAFAEKWTRTSHFWVITQRVVANSLPMVREQPVGKELPLLFT